MEAEFYPWLLLFGQADSVPGMDGKAALRLAIIEAVPVLQRLCASINCLEAIAMNLLTQLGALCAKQTRKATILQGNCPRSDEQLALSSAETVASWRAMIMLPAMTLCQCYASFVTGRHANSAFVALAGALGVLIRLDAILARNTSFATAFAACRWCDILRPWGLARTGPITFFMSMLMPGKVPGVAIQ